MKPYLVNNKEFLKYFSKLPQKNKIYLIPTLNRDQLNTISEICKNVFEKKKKINNLSKNNKKVKPSQKEIKAIAFKKNTL